MKQILRCYIPVGCEEGRMHDILSYCARTGCREVLLFTSSYDSMPTFIPLAELEEYARFLKPLVKTLRQNGIEVSINLLQTLGHVYYPKALDEQFPFQRRVNMDGRVSMAGACPLDENLRNYITSVYRLFAELKPRTIFVDDDFRNFLEGLCCFCPQHLKKFGEAVGKDISLKTLRDAYMSGGGDTKLKLAYHNVLSNALRDFAVQIRLAVHSVSPETRVGVMAARMPEGSFGMDIAQVAYALAGDMRPLVRPQISMYSEGFIRDSAGVFINPGLVQAVFGREIELYPEIENYRYTTYAKSARTTLTQMAVCLLNGWDNLALNIVDMCGQPFSDCEDLIGMIAEKRAYLDTLSDLVAHEHPADGICIYMHKLNTVARRNLHPEKGITGVLDRRPYDNWLPNIGLPVGYNWDETPFRMITGDDVSALSHQEAEELLRGGAVMDARAMQCLQDMGFSSRIGVEVGGSVPLDDTGYEDFHDEVMTPMLHGRKTPLRAISAPGDFRVLRFTGDGFKVQRAVSSIINYKGETVTPSAVITENSLGERFAVLAMMGSNSRFVFECGCRAEQLRNIFEWVAGRRLPVSVLKGTYIWPMVNRHRSGKGIVAGFVNLSTDACREIVISVPAYFEEGFKQVRYVAGDGCLKELGGNMAEDIFCGTPCLRIRHKLEPMEMLVLVITPD
jgi:hypothetical protein